MSQTHNFPELDVSETRVINDHEVTLASDASGKMNVSIDDKILPLDALLNLIGPQRQVERFHARSDQYSDRVIDQDPQSPSHFMDLYKDGEEQALVDLINLRRSLVGEENKELLDSLNTLQEVMINYRDGRNYTTKDTVSQTLAWVAKEIADVIVVATGTAARLGMQADIAFLEVALSNLTKVSPPEFRDDGKIQKGPNYRAPETKNLLIDRD